MRSTRSPPGIFNNSSATRLPRETCLNRSRDISKEQHDFVAEAAMPRAIKLKEAEGNVHGNLGRIAALQGDLDLAKHEYDLSLRVHESIGFEMGIAATSRALKQLDSWH